MLQEKGINIHREVVYSWTEMLLNIQQSRNTDDLYCWRLETDHFILHSVWGQNSPLKWIQYLLSKDSDVPVSYPVQSCLGQ